MSQKYSQDEAQALVKALKEGNQLAFSIVYKTYAAQTFSEKRRNRRDKTYKQIPFYNVEERSAQYVERLKEKYLFT